MRQLPRRGQAYLLGCYLLGMLALCWLLFTNRSLPTQEDWLLGVGIAMVAAICQVFAVARKGTAGQRSDHLTLAPLFAALLLLPRPLLALVIVVTFLPEWYFRRRSWFGQVFNIASFLVAATAARLSLYFLTGHYRFEDTGSLFSVDAFNILLPIPIFLGTQSLLLALVLKLVRGQPFGQSGLFTPSHLLLELALICMGLSFATSWIVDPLYGILAALPLVLIFQALHVPNLKDEAATDPKTGLANMRHFNLLLARECERAARSGQPFSLLMCDLDYLRNINNTYGHQAGDVVLIGIADIMKRNIRGSDVAARFGGEEFVILLADTDSKGAQRVAERLRHELEQSHFEVGSRGGPIHATLSIGVASFPDHGRSGEVLLREADLAVYQAKREGRNRVVVAGRVSRALAGEWAREHLVPISTLDTALNATAPGALQQFIDQVTRSSSNAQASTDPAHSRARTSGASAQPKPQGHGSRSPGPPRQLLAVISAIVVAGVAGLGPGFPFEPILLWPLILFAGLTVLAEQLAIDLFSQGKSRTSVSTVVILGATFVYGELGVLATALAAAISMKIKASSPFHRMFFNFGTMLLSAEGALWTFRILVSGSIAEASITSMILPAVVAGLMFYVINHALLCLIRGLHEGRRPWYIWYAEYRWLWPHYTVLGALGLIVALGYQTFGIIGIAAFMAPVAMMHLAFKQYIDHTKVYIEELQRMNGRITDSYEATLQALSRALDTRDEETEEHSRRVRRYTELIARHLGIPCDELADISRGALLHDIGKIGVPDSILLKPGKLTSEELALMRKHPEIGYSMIAHIPFLAKAAQVVLHHHEAWNGSGYPSGLAGENIPLGARIFAVADTFDAMTTDRPYRKALPMNVAIAELERCRGTQFDPSIVDVFVAIPSEQLLTIQEEVASSESDKEFLDMSALVVGGRLASVS